ncbi:MAG: LptF/LptG family permease [Candidatus Delongbacteria bacterium]|nr:LptF/LptG family permease [Candidatus Delongbacteria bacterium]
MTKLQKYITKSFIGPLIITFLLSTFMLLMQFLWKYIDDLVGKDLEWHVIAELLLYASATLVPMALPLAILLSSLMLFGNMGENYELFALKSSGISLYRIMKPLIILIFIISIGAFYFSNNILPITNLKMRTLLYDVRNQRPEISLQEGIFTDAIDNFSIKVREKDKKDNTLQDILIYDHRGKHSNASVITADHGTLKVTSDKSYIILTLYDGYYYDDISDHRRGRRSTSFPYQTTNFKKKTIYLETEGFGLNRSDEDLFKDNFEMLSLGQLDNAMDSLGYDLIRRKQVVGTNIMKYSLFRGLRAHDPNRNVVHHETSHIILKGTRVLDSVKNISIDSAAKSKNNVHDSDTKNHQTTEVEKEQDEMLKKPKSKAKKDQAKVDEMKNLDVSFPYAEIDTIDKSTIEIINVDSLYNQLSTIERNRMVNFAQNHARSTQTYIYYAAKEIEGSRRWITRHEIEWHKKFVLSVSCLVLFFIGAPLGAIIRKGGFGMPVVISVLLFIIYFIISMFSEKMVRETILPPEIGMWLSTFILLPVGFILTIKAANDSMNVRPETYDLIIQKLRALFKRKRRKHKKNA